MLPPPTHAMHASGSRPHGTPHLAPRLVADHRLEVAHHGGIRMRPRHRADDVERVTHGRDPVAQRLVHGVLERAAPRLDDVDRRAEELHAEDVQALSPHVLRAHEDLAPHAEERGHGRGRDAVLSGAGLGDETRLLQAARQERLTDRVVDLVRAGVEQVLALQEDARAAEPAGEVPCGVERRRPTCVLAEPARELASERGLPAVALPGTLELQERGHQGLGDVASSVLAEMAARVRQLWHGG